MKILSTSPSTKTKQYIRHSRHENLSVIPYVRGRLIFAELVARAITTGQYDDVLVDLPSFLNGGHFGTILTGLFPSVSTLVIRNTKGRFISFPFAPNDAAACAIAAVQRTSESEQQARLEFVDDIQIINYQEYLNHPEPALPDDYGVHVDGLENWFERPFLELDTTWKELPEQDRFYLQYRAGQVASRLAKGKRTLLVCEYRLWHLVESYLEQHQPTQPNQLILPWTNLSAALVLEDPYQFWAMGLHDDYPAIVHQFYECIKGGQLDNFDSWTASMP